LAQCQVPVWLTRYLPTFWLWFAPTLFSGRDRYDGLTVDLGSDVRSDDAELGADMSRLAPHVSLKIADSTRLAPHVPYSREESDLVAPLLRP
jgi:hypothetical protein